MEEGRMYKELVDRRAKLLEGVALNFLTAQEIEEELEVIDRKLAELRGGSVRNNNLCYAMPEEARYILNNIRDGRGMCSIWNQQMENRTLPWIQTVYPNARVVDGGNGTHWIITEKKAIGRIRRILDNRITKCLNMLNEAQAAVANLKEIEDGWL